MTTITINSTQDFRSEIVTPNREYIIGGDIYLTATESIAIGSNSILRFNGGCIHNGILVGQNTRIANPSDSVIFDDVELAYEENPANNAPITGWLGECKDVWFSYSEATKAHFKIVKSVCQFETCLFSRRTYYIEQWARIPLRCFGCEIRGDGTTFILPGNKGSLSSVPGVGNRPQYATHCLFEKGCVNIFPGYNNGERAGRFIVSGLTILDNDEVIREQGWGESMSDFGITVNPPNPQSTVGFTYYKIFRGGANYIEFKNVTYDGCGGLWTDFDHYIHIHQFLIEDCCIKCAQFAFEFKTMSGQNITSAKNQNMTTCGGYCDSLRISRCHFRNYAENLLVGPLSFVSDEPGYTIHHLLVENCVFYSEKEANLELSGCEYIDIRNNAFLSVQCSSDHATSGGQTVRINKKTDIVGNRFLISDPPAAADGLRICSGDLFLLGNEFVLDFSKATTGAFSIIGYGDNTAFISGNTFLFKRTDITSQKTFFIYRDILPWMQGNHYIPENGLANGQTIVIVGDGYPGYLETGIDPRFSLSIP